MTTAPRLRSFPLSIHVSPTAGGQEETCRVPNELPPKFKANYAPWTARSGGRRAVRGGFIVVNA